MSKPADQMQSGRTGNREFKKPVNPANPANIEKVYLFDAGSHVIGAAGGRSSVDTIAKTNLPPFLSGKTVHAFVSVSTLDSIANMPNTYNFPNDVPVVMKDGTKLASNWSDLINKLSMVTIASNYGLSSLTYIWTGSDDDGNCANTCNGWTDIYSSNCSSISSRARDSDSGDVPCINIVVA